tara:strand:+ start:1088 stop:1360 length:273 start_codon:yes stop_codon:yes gene_type:complete
MPRYNYECTFCGHWAIYMHSSDERIEICEKCEKKTMIKLLSKPFIRTKKDPNSSQNVQQVGELTKEYIEENKKILETEKKEAKKETYEPS